MHSRRNQARQVCPCAAIPLLLALLCLASFVHIVPPPAHASTINVHYEDRFDDVLATEDTAPEIKAAFLLRFPDFVSWKNAPGDTLRIGVSADSTLLEQLSRLAENENRSGLGAPRAIIVIGVTELEDVGRCDILVLGDRIPQDQAAFVAAAHQSGTLIPSYKRPPESRSCMGRADVA